MQSKQYYDTVKKIVTKRKLPKLPAYDTFTWPELPPEHTYVLVPKGLSFKQWDKLLKNTCNGLWVASAYNKAPSKGDGWGLAVAYTGELREFNISYTESTKKYGKLMSIEEYLALQWLQLEQGLQPVDRYTWTWLKKEDGLGLVNSRAPRGYWFSGGGQFIVVWFEVGSSNDVLGVRVPAWSKQDSNLTPSVETSIFELEEVVISGVRFVREDRV